MSTIRRMATTAMLSAAPVLFVVLETAGRRSG
jgi:hypothetical protein